MFKAEVGLSDLFETSERLKRIIFRKRSVVHNRIRLMDDATNRFMIDHRFLT